MTLKRQQDRRSITIDDVRRMEPQLHAWAEMAAQAYGFYSGINDAIKRSRDKSTTVAHHASDLRQQIGLMAVIRAFAVMDRGSPVSFQSVYRYLQSSTAKDELSHVYALAEPPSTMTVAAGTVEASITRYLAAYRAIDFQAFGRMQSFRNGQIAHVSWPEIAAAKVTYADLEAIVRACCVMAGELKLMLTGCNAWPIGILEDSHERAYRFWVAAINADADGKLELQLT